MKTGNIKRIVVESGTEPCNVDVDMLHRNLLALPAEIYLRLYQMMKARIEPWSVTQIDLTNSVKEANRKHMKQTGRNLFE